MKKITKEPTIYEPFSQTGVKLGFYTEIGAYNHFEKVVFGDFSYFNPSNEINRKMIHRILQASADEVFAVFYTGIVPSNSPLEYYLPTVEKENINFTPMFFWSDAQDKLLRRKNLADPYSSEMTDNWWGWTTLWALQDLYTSKTISLQSAVLHSLGYRCPGLLSRGK